MRAFMVVLSAVLMLLVAGVCVGGEEVEEASSMKVGQMAPAFGGTWVTTDGKTPQLTGRVYLVDFWFEQCTACVAGMPAVKDLGSKYESKGLVVIGPSTDNEVRVKKFRQMRGFDYPMLAKANESVKNWQIKFFPALFLVDKTGKIIWKGEEKNAELVLLIEAALAK